jgi:Cu+-exporting ATPase
MDQFVGPQKFDLAIDGMTCASCVARVEKVLGRVPGVVSVAVNLATETAHVESGAGGSLAAMVAAVEGAGYHASARPDHPAKRSHREFYELLASATLSAPLLAGIFLGLPGWTAFLLAAPVQFWLGARFYAAGWRALKAGTGNMDLLVALGTSAAFALSVYDFAFGGPLYFESSAVVITLIRLGKFLEGRAKRDAARALTGLASLRPDIAHRGGQDVAVGRLRRGDVIELRPGERVPMDGDVLEGQARFDESHLTGESVPVLRGPGAAVLAGALCLDAVVCLRITVAQGETFLDRMGRMIDAAQASKPRVQKLADRVAAVFVPVVVGIAVLTFAGWMAVHAPVSTALINAVSVLVIACPCALGLATPAAILAGTGVAAKNGILVRNADAIAQAAKVDLVVFDKTGTLTIGQPVLRDVRLFNGASRDEAMRVAAALAAADSHPLAFALRMPGVAPATGVKALSWRGIEGVVDGARYILGSDRLVEDAGGHAPEIKADGATISYLATAGGKVLAAFAFGDAIRPGAAQAVAALRAKAIGVMLLSGDRAEAAEAVGHELGITDIVSRATPAQKRAVIAEKRAAGHVVAMVGDGVNDAAALAAADVGMAIGAGADIAFETADFALLRPAPALVGDALALSGKIWWVLREGLFWAVIYNIVGIPLAALGYLSPMVAGGAMAASSVCVLGNALRLRRWRPA